MKKSGLAYNLIRLFIKIKSLVVMTGFLFTEWTNQTDSVTSVNSKTGAVVINKTDVGLANVDNTSDDNKPISTATQTALNAKANSTDLHTHSNKATLDATTASFTTAKDTKLDGITANATANDTDANLKNRSNHTGVQPISSVTSLQATLDSKISNTSKGSNNGVAELDSTGRVPASQLPSYVDDVEEYATKSNFPTTGESGKIYVAADVNKTYRWTGSDYVEIGGGGVALGETSSTAYRGDRGKTAYDHSQLTSGNPHDVTKTNVGLGNVDNTSDANKPVSIATQTALNAKVSSSSASTDNAIAVFDGTTGKTIKTSGATVDASNNLTIAGDTVAFNGGSASLRSESGNVKLIGLNSIWANSVRSNKGDLSTTGSNTLLQWSGDTADAAVQVTPVNVAQKGFVVKGMASQSGNLQEWQNSAGVANASIDSSGALNTTGYKLGGTNLIDTDSALAANSDTKIPSQKATKAYVDAKNVVLKASVGANSFNDTTTETSIMQSPLTIAAGTLKVGDALIGEFGGQLTNNTGSAMAVNARLKFGSTVLCNISYSPGSNMFPLEYQYLLEATLINPTDFVISIKIAYGNALNTNYVYRRNEHVVKSVSNIATTSFDIDATVQMATASTSAFVSPSYVKIKLERS